MGNEVKEKLTKIGTRILTNARNELYLSMRFLDVALNALAYEFNLSTFFVGTDGVNIYYNPRFLMERYENQPLLINRAYLHMILHCIFRHMYEAEEKEEEEWNLACDIATEYIIDSLDYKAVTRVVSDYREEVYHGLEKRLKVLNAEGIYKVLMEDEMPYADFVRLSTEFLSDDHIFWKQKRNESLAGQNPNQDEEQNESSKKESNDQERNKSENENENLNETEKNTKDESKENTKENIKENEKVKENTQEDIKENTNNNNREKENGSENLSKNSELQNRLEQERKQEKLREWNKIGDKMKTNLETFSYQIGNETSKLQKALNVELRERYDYKNFLRKFAVQKEVMQVDTDSFDYGFYHYGIQTYGNMPLMEHLEYKEEEKIEEFVIAIDTSGSCSGEVVQKFLEQTYAVLKTTESFLKKVQIHIIQCDMEIKDDTIIRNMEEFEQYMKEFTFHGFGGTDFRPVFEYVDELIHKRELKQLKGMIYFTDGFGTYPTKRPNYDVAFLFLKDDYTDANVPSWAMKLILSSEDIMSYQ